MKCLVDEERAHHGSEALLARSVPNLEADFGATDGDLFGVEEGPGGSHGLCSKAFLDVASDQRGFPYTYNQHVSAARQLKTIETRTCASHNDDLGVETGLGVCEINTSLGAAHGGADRVTRIVDVVHDGVRS